MMTKERVKVVHLETAVPICSKENRFHGDGSAYCMHCMFRVSGLLSTKRAYEHSQENLNHKVVITTYEEC